jgi:hypothetical protein
VTCERTLDCQYFKELFLNVPLNEDLDVLEKQQYYIRFCHKVGGVLICLYPKDLRYDYFMNSMMSMVVFKCLKDNNCGP